MKKILSKILLTANMILLSSLIINGDAKVTESKTPIAKPKKVAQSIKIAYLNMNDLMGPNSESKEWTKLMNQISKDLEPGEKQLKEIYDQFTKDKAELESLKKSGIATEQKLEELSKKLDENAYKLQALDQRKQMFIQEEQRKSYAAFWPKVTECISEVKKEQGWNAVCSDLIEVDAEFDITKEVVSKLNAKYDSEQKSKNASKLQAPKP